MEEEDQLSLTPPPPYLLSPPYLPPPPPPHPPGHPCSIAGADGAGAAEVRRAAWRLRCRPATPGAHASHGHPSPQFSSGFATYAFGFCGQKGKQKKNTEEELHVIL